VHWCAQRARAAATLAALDGDTIRVQEPAAMQFTLEMLLGS
jgi:hypothetical protein